MTRHTHRPRSPSQPAPNSDTPAPGGRRKRQVSRDPDPERPFVIDPLAVFRPLHIQEALGLCPGTVAREVRLRRLRATKRSGKVFLLGQWVIDWLAGGPGPGPGAPPGGEGRATPGDG
jgi:hypothetical protein